MSTVSCATGKSSVIGMMTGLTTPTAGDCLIKGCSIVDDTQGARGCLGYCPQSNVMYGRISVMEHLQIYAAIKGIAGGSWSAAAVEAAEEMIRVSSNSFAWLGTLAQEGGIQDDRIRINKAM